ncbi:MAG: YqeG family HAD IIIA-type phosphatase [Deinococcota bacterium]|nr:YqeG family HAD IIIA-type phosphatase [Deinococcota bacterium]
MLKPKLVVTAVHEVTPKLLKAHGLRAVMVDLDDTLVASTGVASTGAGLVDLDARFTAWALSLRESGIPLLILSNGTSARVKHYAALLGVQGFAMVGKPSQAAFRRGLDLLGTPPRQTAMVGDQLFTDVLGANLAGMTSILVEPLSAGRLPHTRLLRRLERMILGRQRGDPVPWR